MPVLLNRAYALTAIGASLQLTGEEDVPEPRGVHVEVDLPDDVRLQHDLTLADLGLPLDLRGIDKALADRLPGLPPAWHTELLRALEPAPRDQPVWLDFRRPFGHLPAIPWERLLLPQLGFPLLRLPFSAVPPPDVPADDLRVAVCAPWSGTTALRDYLGTVVQILPGARVDVFTADREAVDWVAPGTMVRFHEPPTEDELFEPTSPSPDAPVDSRPDNPWLRWMLDEIAPGTVDVVHLICSARVSENYGLLDFGASPAGVDSPRAIRLVSVAQLLACLTELGAWSLSVAMPESRAPRRGEAGLRIFMHRMTGLLSGPVILHAPAGPATELAAAYRFLYTPGPHQLPMTPTLMVACHPLLVQSRTASTSPAPRKDDVTAERIESALRDCTLDAGVLRQARRDPTEPSAWVASSQRILERWTSNLLGTEVDPAGSDTASRGVTDALSFISRSIESSVRGKRDDR
ncbi:hypothetical protein SAMN05661080_03611 [Modestobacter sp. DSM 44400]|uniref:hypothetical protein n=1 Tax=Modestobacter sp. DSM 44400 TaxID=1550230 RepID=UPI00089470AA|nr:hypothetical protein [Modestobacter sp. DSM 44400]SDY48120.1 hypothetical protein SAMN05661080_03611 [Modestobacter sp. DSM 44400]